MLLRVSGLLLSQQTVGKWLTGPAPSQEPAKEGLQSGVPQCRGEHWRCRAQAPGPERGGGMSQPQERTVELLEAVESGDPGALDELFELVYEELHALARAQRARWEGDYTLNTTALVHEAYLKLFRSRSTAADPGAGSGPGWNDRSHFLAVAARAMRQILVNYARRGKAAKRGGGARPVTLDESMLLTPEAAEEMLALDEALERLEALSPRQAKAVECRFFAGLTHEDTAEALGTSVATVKRDLNLANAWLFRELAQEAAQAPPEP